MLLLLKLVLPVCFSKSSRSHDQDSITGSLLFRQWGGSQSIDFGEWGGSQSIDFGDRELSVALSGCACPVIPNASTAEGALAAAGAQVGASAC